METKPVKLGTYGKMIRAIWPELNIDRGPIGLLEDLLAKSGMTLEQVFSELNTARTYATEYVERHRRMEERQERIEASLDYLVSHIETAKHRSDNGRGSSDNDGTFNVNRIGSGEDGSGDSARGSITSAG